MAQNYKYNGKELNEELGLEWYDFGWRNYDASLGRWMNIDQLSEKYYGASPYNYALNNPVILIDPDGRDVVISIDENGNITISANIHINGSGANEKEAKKIETSIETYWNGAGLGYTDEEGNEYTVKFDVNVQVYDEETTELESGDNLIEIKDEDDRSYVDGVRSNGGTWYSKESFAGANNFTYAHEFGHLAGLKDRYSDSSNGSIADEGWEGNIMGEWGGNVEQKNINGIVEGTVRKYNKFMDKYSNYQAWTNKAKRSGVAAKGIVWNTTDIKKYEKRGNVFRNVKKPLMVRLTGN